MKKSQATYPNPPTFPPVVPPILDLTPPNDPPIAVPPILDLTPPNDPLIPVPPIIDLTPPNPPTFPPAVNDPPIVDPNPPTFPPVIDDPPIVNLTPPNQHTFPSVNAPPFVPVAPGGPQPIGSRIICKGVPEHSLAIRDGKVTLAPTSQDDKTRQAWIKETKWSNNVKDTDGSPIFSFLLLDDVLDNPMALMHSGAACTVGLTPFTYDHAHLPTMWSRTVADNAYGAIRVPLGDLVLDVDSSNQVVLRKWTGENNDNQKWSFSPL